MENDYAETSFSSGIFATKYSRLLQELSSGVFVVLDSGSTNSNIRLVIDNQKRKLSLVTPNNVEVWGVYFFKVARDGVYYNRIGVSDTCNVHLIPQNVIFSKSTEEICPVIFYSREGSDNLYGPVLFIGNGNTLLFKPSSVIHNINPNESLIGEYVSGMNLFDTEYRKSSSSYINYKCYVEALNGTEFMYYDTTKLMIDNAQRKIYISTLGNQQHWFMCFSSIAESGVTYNRLLVDSERNVRLVPTDIVPSSRPNGFDRCPILFRNPEPPGEGDTNILTLTLDGSLQYKPSTNNQLIINALYPSGNGCAVTVAESQRPSSYFTPSSIVAPRTTTRTTTTSIMTSQQQEEQQQEEQQLISPSTPEQLTQSSPSPTNASPSSNQVSTSSSPSIIPILNDVNTAPTTESLTTKDLEWWEWILFYLFRWDVVIYTVSAIVLTLSLTVMFAFSFTLLKNEILCAIALVALNALALFLMIILIITRNSMHNRKIDHIFKYMDKGTMCMPYELHDGNGCVIKSGHNFTV